MSLPPTTASPRDEIDYLLKELELQFAVESKARDRVEQMMQYLLAAIAAIVGAGFLIINGQSNAVLVGFIGSLLVLAFGMSAFYRACRLRNSITHARVNRWLIRRELLRLGLASAAIGNSLEGPLNAFYGRIVFNLAMLALFCGLVGGLAVGFGAALLFLGLSAGHAPVTGWIVFLAAPIGFIVTFLPLLVILINYRSAAVELVKKL